MKGLLIREAEARMVIHYGRAMCYTSDYTTCAKVRFVHYRERGNAWLPEHHECFRSSFNRGFS
jgi:hypothetical protein